LELPSRLRVERVLLPDALVFAARALLVPPRLEQARERAAEFERALVERERAARELETALEVASVLADQPRHAVGEQAVRGLALAAFEQERHGLGRLALAEQELGARAQRARLLGIRLGSQVLEGAPVALLARREGHRHPQQLGGLAPAAPGLLDLRLLEAALGP